MALERIEVRLGNVTVEEQVLSKAIAELPEGRGMKTHFMKERLIRGYALIQKEVERIFEQSDPYNALNRMADSINSGHFYALRAVMDQMSAEKSGAGVPRGAVPVPASLLASIPSSPAPAEQQESISPVPAPAAQPVGRVEEVVVAPPPAIPPQAAPAVEVSVQAAPLPSPAEAVVRQPAETVYTPSVAMDGAQGEVVEQASPPAPAAPKMPDWSKMRNLATGGGKG